MKKAGWRLILGSSLSFLGIPLAFAQEQASTPSQLSFVIPLLFVFIIFYFLLIRPQQKQQKQRKLMLAGVKKGDLIITSGGFHGKVVGVAGNVLTVELADNLKVKMDREGVLTLRKTDATQGENEKQ